MILEIDGRLLANSGIGRYLSEILKNLHDNFIDKSILRLFSGQNPPVGISVIRDDSLIYGVVEQFSRVTPKVGLRWTPHYNFPILSESIHLLTVHDVAHLALSKVFSPIQRLYAYTMLALGGVMATHVFFVSDFSRREFKRRVGILPDSWSIVHCGVDLEYWAHLEEGSPSALCYFLAVGNIKSHKNLISVLRAFKLVRESNPEVRLKIVGKISGFKVGDSAFWQEIEDDSVGIEILGQVSDDELRGLYRGAVGLVFPSLYEGFGLPPLEAMAAGCPSVVSSTGALDAICADGLGIFCDPADVCSIASGMRQLLSWEDKERRQWRLRSAEHVKKFSWEHSARLIWDVIHYHARECIV